MAWIVCCHHDGSFMWMPMGHPRNAAMIGIGAGFAAVGSSPGSGIAIAASSSTSEEAPAAARLTHRSREECVQQTTEETSTEFSWLR